MNAYYSTFNLCHLNFLLWREIKNIFQYGLYFVILGSCEVLLPHTYGCDISYSKSKDTSQLGLSKQVHASKYILFFIWTIEKWTGGW